MHSSYISTGCQTNESQYTSPMRKQLQEIAVVSNSASVSAVASKDSDPIRTLFSSATTVFGNSNARQSSLISAEKPTQKNYLSTFNQSQESPESTLVPSQLHELSGAIIPEEAISTAAKPLSLTLDLNNLHNINIRSIATHLLQSYLSSNKKQFVTLLLIFIDLGRSMAGIFLNFIKKTCDLDLNFLLDIFTHTLGLIGFFVSNIFLLELICCVWVFRLRFVSNFFS